MNNNWSNETVMRFLELYKMHPCIWDPKNIWHKNKHRLHDAWVDIQNNIEEPFSIQELKKKKESLMSAYRGYRTKIVKSEISGPVMTTEDVYRPTWFAYSFIDSFLGNIYTPYKGEFNNDHLNVNADSNNSLDDSEEQNITMEGDPLNQIEEKYSPNSSFEHKISVTRESLSPEQSKISTEETSTTALHNKRLQRTKKQMNEAFNILKTVSQQHLNEDEDECSIFGKLIAKKMRKLSEEHRDIMMIRIHELFYNVRHEKCSGERPNSTSSIVSST